MMIELTCMAVHYSLDQIKSFLSEYPIMSLSAVNGDKPLSSVVVFAFDEGFSFFFVARSESYKVEAIKSNPMISFSVWEKDKMLVQADGKAELIEGDDAEKAMDLVVKSMEKVEDFWPPLVKFSGHDYSVVKITVSWLRALDITTKTMKEAESPFSEYKFTEN